MGPLEHSVTDLAPLWNVSPFPQMTTPDPLEHSGLPSDDDGGRKSVPLEPLEHSVLGVPQDQQDVSSWMAGRRPTDSARGWGWHCCGGCWWRWNL